MGTNIFVFEKTDSVDPFCMGENGVRSLLLSLAWERTDMFKNPINSKSISCHSNSREKFYRDSSEESRKKKNLLCNSWKKSRKIIKGIPLNIHLNEFEEKHLKECWKEFREKSLMESWEKLLKEWRQETWEKSLKESCEESLKKKKLNLSWKDT